MGKPFALTLAPFVGLLTLLLGSFVVLAPDDVAYACSPTDSDGADPELTSEQWRNARTITNEGTQRQVPSRGLVIAIATALQESGLRNLGYGDRDSLGLFQQRPSMGWGTPAQVQDPSYAAGAFFDGFGANPGLLDIPRWQALPLWLAADSVQRSAFPLTYQDHEVEATAIVDALAHDSGDCTRGDAVCPPVDHPALVGLTPDAKQVVYCVIKRFGITALGGVGDRPSNPTSDHPSGRAVDIMIADYGTAAGRALGDAVAAWFQAHAAQLGITYLIWDARIWSVGRAGEGWRPYSHPSGASDATSLHRDHAHVSVVGNATTRPT